jgi:hypothetical protein
MRKLFFIAVLAALGLALPAAAGNSQLVVAMHDPGCHWFQVGSKYTKSVVRHGPVTLLNRDEAALTIKGPGGTRHEPLGGKLRLHAKGTYRITMVHQAPDDNHLILKIK